jgi:hypothetical protein
VTASVTLQDDDEDEEVSNLKSKRKEKDAKPREEKEYLVRFHSSLSLHLCL